MKTGRSLATGPFAVLLVDDATGIVLTRHGEVSVREEDDLFLIFDNLDAARAFIAARQKEKNTIECCIYNASYEFLECIEAPRYKKR